MRMLRLFYFLLYMIILSVSLSACHDNKDEPEVEPAPKPFFEIDKGNYKIGSEAQIVDVLIHTNIKISVGSIDYLEEDKGWISITNVVGDGEDYTYQFKIKENTDEHQRTGYIVFRRTDNLADLPSNSVIIIQEGATP